MIEMSLNTAIWISVGFFVFVKIILPLLFPENDGDYIETRNNGYNEKQINNNSKIYKKIDKENLSLENLLIQKEELENEIDSLEFESDTDFEKQTVNSTRIKKLKLKIKHIDISIEDKYNKIDNLNRELKGMY